MISVSALLLESLRLEQLELGFRTLFLAEIEKMW